MIMAVFFYLKLDVLINKKDVNILSTTNRLFYNDEDEFTFANNFNVAVAFTAYDDKEEWILDPTYGTLRFVEYSWEESEDQKLILNRIPLETEICTAEQLGLTEDSSKAEFLPTIPK